jgi:PBP4 family serine-type D-alanyl-D-alanine carboxypeptidase
VKLSTIALILAIVATPAAQSRDTLADRIDAITGRPEFRHAIFGIEFYDLEANAVVYEHNSDRFFVPGSTTKLVTMGSALQLLGADFRFHTKIYRTGEIAADGTLRGDLVLVASGDPNLSGRLRAGDTLAFENVDHSYGGPDSHGLEGDPLAVVRELAEGVASRGIKRVEGRVVVDASLYAEGERDGGTGFVVSPIMINDNAVDVVVRPGADGAHALLDISPKTSYVTFVNQIATGPAGGEARIRTSSDATAGDGTHTVTLSGTMPAGAQPVMFAYRVPEPARFAEVVVAEALHERGIPAAARRYEDKRDFTALANQYSDDRAVAEHVSPPISEEVKVTLKVSQNLHATATPFLIGALVAHKGTDAAGFAEMKKFLASTGADISGASQSDGAGADAHFTPAFMVGYLTYLAKQPSAQLFHDALPVLGKDGTLWNIQTRSPAAGHVFAKTGTFQVRDLLHDQMMVTGKGLAGYMTTAGGRRLVFAIYANNVEVKDGGAVTQLVGDALGAIAAAAYDAKIERPRKSRS